MIAVYTDVVDLDPAPGVALLEQAGFEVRVLGTADPDLIATRAADAAALLVGYSPVTADLLDRLPALEIIATQSVGVDHIDVAAALARRVQIGNVPDAATEEVAAHALAMCLALERGLPFLDRDVRAGRWDGTSRRLRRPSALALGVLGLGRIGQRLVELARPVFGRIVGHDPMLPDARWPLGVERSDLDGLLAVSDVLSLHAPQIAGAAPVIGARELALLPPGACLVNVARGGLVDENALLAALERGTLGAAALDVLAVEPPEPDNPLLRHPRTLITPHAAYLSPDSARDYVLIQASNVVEWSRTGRPRNPVP